ncbi:cyclic nucleotide-binding domain-containing protein [Acaryochloris sp. IP29b_bin.137]|uniref:cyclic nucleotide-binding domain-containing protein n=1 Tax=Acaryochloris sp. IP29b_bin.137 TaxID=2969217 RepID=UPI00260332DE|nr:cyclic nucleotide-binding domain-containing protein [Acaryochloris sp. IP29b_bin.137]
MNLLAIDAQFFRNLLLVMGILGGAAIADWMIGRWIQRQFGKSRQSSRNQFQLLQRFSIFLLRLGIWLIAFYNILTLVPGLQPFGDLLKEGLAVFPDKLWESLNTPFFDLDRKPVSLLTVLIFLITTVLVFVGARVCSQWLKKSVLPQTRMEQGAQAAISTIISYTLAVIGFIILLRSVGLDISSLAVIAGVLGIGLGFGLQELASNFVSGLTLLLEQQLRVGDFVEVDGVLGTIERISIRSTIVRTQDRLFVVVPNQHFFAKNVINWTYQTPESRLHIPVNVAYGSDTVLVTEALLIAARAESRVLKYPPPQVWFKAFGDDAYQFELLVWINQPCDFQPIQSSLNFLIEQELNRKNIEIPFPQRDLWLKNPEVLTKALQPSLETAPSSSPQSTGGEIAKQKTGLKITKNSTLRSLLRQVSYFENCTNVQLRVLIEQGYRKFFTPGQVIFRENEFGESFYVILSGKVEVFSQKLDRRIATLTVGDFFGEISLLTGAPRTATMRVIEATTLFVVDRQALQKLLQNYKTLAEEIAKSLSQRQQVLEELGLTQINPSESAEADPFIWIRRRIQTLFGI